MQQLLESSPNSRHPADGLPRKGGYNNNHNNNKKRLRFVLIGIAFMVVCYVVFNSGVNQARTELPLDGVAATQRKKNSAGGGERQQQVRVDADVENAAAKNNDNGYNDEDVPKKKASNINNGVAPVDVSVNLLSPWGYNKDRNIPRAKAILGSIAADLKNGRFEDTSGTFSLVDYGSDQGYFSISVAKLFPTARVMGVEMGGVGGEIWKKADSQDVLSIQEGKIMEHSVTNNMQICQAKMLPERFFQLKEKQLVSDYQFVLSVFHWFDLPTRKDFDETISTLFLNARTTFIELPIIGDNSPLIRKQVGWKNFVKWYDGRTDMTQIIAEAAESQGLSIKVSMVASVPWVKWQRETYRVDVQSVKGEDAPAINFGCSDRRDIYTCAQRELYSKC